MPEITPARRIEHDISRDPRTWLSAKCGLNKIFKAKHTNKSVKLNLKKKCNYKIGAYTIYYMSVRLYYIIYIKL